LSHTVGAETAPKTSSNLGPGTYGWKQSHGPRGPTDPATYVTSRRTGVANLKPKE